MANVRVPGGPMTVDWKVSPARVDAAVLHIALSRRVTGRWYRVSAPARPVLR